MMTSRQAFAKYGQDICQQAYELNKTLNDPYKVGQELDLTTRQAQVAIKAWQEHLKQQHH